MRTGHKTLVILAAFVWVSGGIVLLTKGTALANALISQDPASTLLWSMPAIGLVVGLLKIKYFFNFFCRRNLDRIEALEDPRIWQFFRPQFFFMLLLMMLFGATLSRFAVGNYPVSVFVVALDFSLATALLGSSLVFRTSESFAKK